MRAQLRARSLVNGQANEQSNGEYFSYQEGQHRVVANGKLHLPEEIKIIKTRYGKRWGTSSMEVELAGDVLEVRDGLGKVVDAVEVGYFLALLSHGNPRCRSGVDG